MFRHAPPGLAVVASIVVCVTPEVTHACIDRVIVRPVGRITSADPVRLEVEVFTPSSPPIHTQPTGVSIVGDSVTVRIYVVGGLDQMPDSMTEVIELGVLDPRTYHYAVALNPTTDPPAYTADGTFCVEDSGCANAACRCPVFTPQYTIISLGTLGGYSGDTSWGQAINDLGQVAGRSLGPNGQHAFLWQNGTMTDLGTFSPGDIESSGLGINNHGDVVGYSYGSGAVLWRNGQVIHLGALGKASIAYAINDAGQIVGSSVPWGYEYHAVLWENGELIDLTTMFGAPTGKAEDINALGQIVVGNIILEPDRAITELPTLGGAYSGGLALNDPGQVVGKSQRGDDSEYDWHAFVWDGGVMTDLGAIGRYVWSEAVDINNSGQVIGWGDGPDPWCGGSFLYEPGEGLRKLPDLIPVDSGWASVWQYPALWAFGINNAGQIAGTGEFQGETRDCSIIGVDS
jgi:probable HAF family extracellular repeat protein